MFIINNAKFIHGFPKLLVIDILRDSDSHNLIIEPCQLLENLLLNEKK